MPFRNWTKMKLLLIIIGHLIMLSHVTFAQNEICETCVQYTLELSDNKLQGSSLQFAGYDVSINLPPEFSADSLSVDHLFSIIRKHNITGDFIFPNGKTTEIKYSLIPYNDTVTVFMKTSNGWYPWDKLKIENGKLIFSYDYWYCPPATKTDLEILDLCFDYLKDSTKWQQNDDRDCDADKTDDIWSLYCAIQIASVEKAGAYNHRGKVIQITRFVIDELYPDHGYDHTLMEFNNDSSTTFEDLIKVLTIVNDRIEMELLNAK